MTSIGRSGNSKSDTDAAELSRELRQGSGEHLERRRKATVSTLVAAGCVGVIALYQMGVIPHLPEPPLPGFDADESRRLGRGVRALRDA